MALVSERFELSIRVVDTGANQTERTFPMTALTYDDATLEAEDAVEKFAAICEGSIVGYGVKEVYLEDALVLPADAEIENQALLDFTITGDPLKHATMSIPAPAVTIFQGPTGPQYNIVDGSDPALIAWWTLFGAAGTLTLSDGNTLATFVSGKRIHRKSNRG